MHSPLEITMRIAILRYPETFGLGAEEVNPLLQYSFVTAELQGDDIDHDDILSRCIYACELKISEKITEILKSKGRESVGEMLLSNHVKKALMRNTPDETPEPQSNGKTNGKTKSSDNPKKGEKITAKQLRYLGYLQHQLGEKPDYKEIGKLTPQQATMKIKDLEKVLNQG